jgi:hypothetical protein
MQELNGTYEAIEFVPVLVHIVPHRMNTRCAWAGGTCCANYPDFFENNQFYVTYYVTLANVLFLKNF